MPTDVDATTDEDAADRRAARRVIAIAALIVMAAVALVLASDDIGESLRSAPWWFAVVIALGFGIAERHVFDIEYRHNAVSFSLAEVPTMLALTFLSPPVAVAIRVVASLLAIISVSRPRSYQIVYNGALFAFEMAFASWLVRLLVPHAGAGDARLILVGTLAVAVATFVGGMAVSAAIAQFEGRFLDRVADELQTSVVTTPLGAIVGAVALAPALIDWRLAPLSAVPVLAVWMVLLRHGRLAQAHADLRDLHAFSGVTGRALSLDQLVPDALAEIMRLVRAGSGSLEVLDADGRVGVVHRHGRGVGIVEVDEAATDVDDARADAAGGRLVLPIEDASGTMGRLVLADRSGSTPAFTDDDRSRALQLVDQLAIAMRNAILHAEIEHSATHDALTGLLNRSGFERCATAEFQRTRADCLAVMMLDLDGFKEINDTLGHGAGDRVLREVAERVRSVLTPADLIARFGGDEFAVLLRRDDCSQVREAAERVLFESHAPIGLDDAIAVTTISIGVATAADGEHDVTTLLRRADVAMYAAKRAHAGVEVYRDEIDRRTPDRLSLLADLRAALEADDLTVHYQPKLDIATNVVVGAEALVRWNHPRRGNVSPLDFIQLAEETGLIRLVTDRVLDMALADASRWHRLGFDLGVAVNVSTFDLHDELLADRVLHLLATHEVPAAALTIEITESALMSDAPRVISTIDRLHAAGVSLSLDDFGTGYSSLSYLSRLPVSELKIDRSFIADMLLNPHDETIVRSTVELGHNLGLQVVAEGIENDPTLSRLRQLGCDVAQGYGISRPLDADRFLRWLHANPIAATTHGRQRSS